jgi:hypothetical protein
MSARTVAWILRPLHSCKITKQSSVFHLSTVTTMLWTSVWRNLTESSTILTTRDLIQKTPLVLLVLETQEVKYWV